MFIKCIQCGKSFDLSEAEKDYYEKKGLQVPKRCRQCRQSNRLRNEDLAIPRGREKRQKRRETIRRVPVLTLVMLVAATFAFLNLVRRDAGSKPDTDPGQIETGTATQTDSGNKKRSSSIQPAVLFRSEQLLQEHFEKHGREMGYSSPDEYLAGANAAIHHSDVLHKTQKEDGDDVYFVESTNDFVVVSTDGYIRTYFRPENGIAYYNSQ